MTDTSAFTVDNGYISFPVDTDTTTLYQDALTNINDELPGWIPREGHIEVLMLEQMAQMCAESAQVAALVPQGIFAYFGSLIGINPNAGSSASAFTTWTMVDAQGYTVPGGTQVGYAILGNQLYTFQTVDQFTVPGPNPGRVITGAIVTSGLNVLTCTTGNFTTAGDVGRTVTDGSGTANIPANTTIESVTSPTQAIMSANATGTPGAESITLGDVPGQTTTAPGAVLIESTAVGTAFNGLVPQTLTILTALGFVASVSSVTNTSGGQDPESTTDYLNRLSSELQLLTPRPILPNDFAVLAVNAPDAGVFRAGVINLLNPFNNQLTTDDGTMDPGIGSWTPTNAVASDAVGAHGEDVLRLHASSSATVTAATTRYPAAQNTQYLISITADEPSALASETIAITANYYDVNNASLGSTVGPAVAPSASGLTFLWQSITTPPNTFNVSLEITILNAVSGTNYDFAFANLSFIATSPINLVPDSSMLEVVSALTWTPSSGAVVLTPFTTGVNAFEYTGTNSPSGSLTATSNRFYLPAGQYTFSSFVDGSNIESGTATVVLSNGTTLATLTQNAGIASTLNTTFSVGSASVVTAQFSTNNCTVQTGETLTFVQPQLTPSNISAPYTPGPTWSTPGQLFNQEREVTVVPISSSGTGLLPNQQALVSSYLEGLREVNFEVNVISPNYVGIDVAWSGVASSGFNPNDVQTAVNNALAAYLSPQNWAGGTATPPFWDLTQTVVRYLSIVTIIGETPGLNYPTNVTIGFHGQTALGETDLALPGFAPLPQPGSITGSVT